MKSAAGAKFAAQEDKSILVTGPLAKDVYTFVAPTDLAAITGLRLEALADPSLPVSGPGRSANGNFVLNELKVTLAPKSDASQAEPVVLQGGTADFNQQNYAASAAIDGNEGTGWAVHPETGKTHTAIFETKANAGLEGGSILTITLSQQYQDGHHTLGKFRLSVTDGPRPWPAARTCPPRSPPLWPCPKISGLPRKPPPFPLTTARSTPSSLA